jgi:transcriptional regulator with XRE-family HTH domain
MRDEERALAVAAGQRLVWVRELTKLKQEQVAEAVGVTQGEWSRWERGLRVPPPDVMVQACFRLRISMDYIYRGLLIGVHPDLADELLRLHPGELTVPPIYTGWSKDMDQP